VREPRPPTRGKIIPSSRRAGLFSTAFDNRVCFSIRSGEAFTLEHFQYLRCGATVPTALRSRSGRTRLCGSRFPSGPPCGTSVALVSRVEFTCDVFGNRLSRTEFDSALNAVSSEHYAYDMWKTNLDASDTQAAAVGNENADVWADLDGGAGPSWPGRLPSGCRTEPGSPAAQRRPATVRPRNPCGRRTTRGPQREREHARTDRETSP